MSSKNKSASGTGQINENMVEMMSNKLATKITEKIENQLEKLDKYFEKMERQITYVIEKLATVGKVAETNIDKIKLLNDKVEKLEHKLKTKPLRIIGLKEEPNENLLTEGTSMYINEGLTKVIYKLPGSAREKYNSSGMGEFLLELATSIQQVCEDETNAEM
ncbi:unnamed protein product [Psylliodes chrysocephalus]|uniref:Uncharacterized protein n=1 Tax=Psylliodes chrysocephalus TaxID=3402493 RepID=A0A9P0D0K0_9CUCU|nr:unnamed protein product [Psylliodes chrysocephala]